MATYEIVGGSIQNIYIGTTTIANPIIILEVNGVSAGNCYVVQTIGNSVRFMFPKVDSSGNIYIMAIGQVYGDDLPQLTLSVKVYIAGLPG